MGDKSAIQWTDATWNPTTGCDRVSPGCAHCYALDLAGRLKKMGAPAYQRDGDPRTSGPGFGLTLHEDRLDIPLRWTRPRRIFVNSMSDLYHPLRPFSPFPLERHEQRAMPRTEHRIRSDARSKPEVVARASAKMRAWHANPENKALQSARMQASWDRMTPEERAARSERIRTGKARRRQAEARRTLDASRPRERYVGRT